MRGKWGTVCMIVGALLLLAALSLFFYNRAEDERAGSEAYEIMLQVKGVLEEQTQVISEDSNIPDPYKPEMTVIEIDGYGYIGYLSIPALELELPVMNDLEDTRMKIVPCRYSGCTKTDDLVIAAHNYTRHFGRLNTLNTGDTVIFTDMDGNQYIYEVKDMEILAPTAIPEMVESEYDLTLFTCTYGGQNRMAVRCRKL